jgi:hypothetical protein
MPDRTDALRRLAAFAKEQLQAPVRQYYLDAARLRERPGPFTGLRLRGLRSVLADDLVLRLERLMADAALIASGGNPLTGVQREELARRFEAQAGYMRQFVGQIDRISEPQALARAASYTSAIVQVVPNVETVTLRLPIRPGDKRLECKGFCKCHLDVRALAPGDWDVTWMLDPVAEHCGDCIRLAATWTPLRIRNGQIEKGVEVGPEELKMLKIALGLALRETA